MKRTFYLYFLASCLAGCSGDSNSDSAPVTPVPETPTDPAQPADNGAVKGTDVNTNQVRDDIDRLITQKYSKTPAMAKAARQKAASLQAMMEATTKEQAMAAAERISRASACVRETLPGAENQEVRVEMAHELEAETVNSRDRQSAYLQANQLAGGAYFPEPKSPVCE